MRKTIRIVLVGLAFLFASELCRAAEEEAPAIPKQPPLGTFKMRPELKGQHPRLYFTKADIPEIRRLGKGPSKFFVEAMKSAYLQYVGQDVPAEMPEWKRYVYGFWGLSSMDMLYIVEGEQRYADTAKNWAMWLVKDHWWVRDNLPNMDALSGLAFTYDVLYDQFTEAERKAIRESIYEGIDYISQRFFVPNYWTRDYQNNHMHNRIHGLANGAFAIYGDDPALDVQKYADLAIEQVHKVAEWLPEDGSQHEGPGYWNFGHNWVARMVHLAEHVTGEDIVGSNTHFTTSHWFRIYMSTPGWGSTFNIGDGGGGFGGSLSSICRSIADAKDPWATAVLQKWMEAGTGGFYRYPAWGLLWYDPEIKPRPIAELPLWRFWPDLEMFSIRSSWDDDATGFVFKCGPPGGHKMQHLRGENWANVAHDHPDQNHFLLFAHGKMMAQDDGYPKPKLTQSHNTIVVDGKGQPEEGTAWQQPFPYEDTGTLRDLFLSHNTAYAAGDGSRLYEGAESFVRHVAFVRGQYLMVLDELAGAGEEEHEFQWRLHKDGEWQKHDDAHFSVSDEDVTLDIRFLAPTDGLEAEFLPADKVAKPCLAVTTRGKRARFMAVLVPQKAGAPEVTAERIRARGFMAVRATEGDREDLFGVATRSTSLNFGGVQVEGAAALVCKLGDEVDSAMLVRGVSLSLDGRALLKASAPANVSVRRSDEGMVVEAEAAYKAAGADTDVQIGGFAANADYRVTVNGQSHGTQKADGDGVLHLSLDLKERCIIEVGAAE